MNRKLKWVGIAAEWIRFAATGKQSCNICRQRVATTVLPADDPIQPAAPVCGTCASKVAASPNIEIGATP